jgi:hypothetical protein
METLNKFKVAIVEFDSTQSVIGAYAGLAAPRVSRGLTGETPFDEKECQVLSETIDAMYALQATTPLPIDWRMIGRVRPHVESKREQKDPCPNEFYIISTSSLGYFSCVRSGEVVSVPSIAKAAAFADITMAGTVARELYFRFKTRADFQALQNHSIKRKLSEMVSSYEQVGLTGNPGPRPQN